MNRYIAAACAASLLAASLLLPSTSAFAVERTVGSLRLIGEQRIPLKQDFQGTTVGGLSGADYDAASGNWLLASDDPSGHNPARFYTARMDYDATAFRSVTITGVTNFRQPDGSFYPSFKEFDETHVGEVADIESIRIDPLDGSIWYSSEGGRKRVQHPFVRHALRDGTPLSSMYLPDMFRFSTEERGPRNNAVFEGMSFAADGKSIWISLEGPRYEDGPLPTPHAGADTRISRMDRDGRMLAQYAYTLDPIHGTPGAGKAADNGISEILTVNSHALLVLERAGVQNDGGTYANYVRVYEMETAGATDVRGLDALAGARYTPATKRLVLDLNTLGIRLDNLEALSFGPKLANGHETLMIVSDDNFGATQVMQFLLFEVLP